jgi:hypothetical protein
LPKMSTYNAPETPKSYDVAMKKKEMGSDGWKTGAPGETAAMKNSPARPSSASGDGRKPGAENVNRVDPVKMTGSLSSPEMKTNLKVHTVYIKGGGSQEGQIKNAGADPFAYLGHFRGSKVLECGHNQGAPGMDNSGTPPVATGDATMGTSMRPPTAVGVKPVGPATSMPAPAMQKPAPVKPTFNAQTNPIAATRQSNKARLAATPMGGGARKEVRAENKGLMSAAKDQRQKRNAAGLQKSDMGALKQARGLAKQTNAAAKSTAKADHRMEVGAARQNLRSARQGVRAAMRGK